jgi:hypothetical protein
LVAYKGAVYRLGRKSKGKVTTTIGLPSAFEYNGGTYRRGRRDKESASVKFFSGKKHTQGLPEIVDA